MVWQWGQFLDHDISLTPACARNASRSSCRAGIRTSIRSAAVHARSPSTGLNSTRPRGPDRIIREIRSTRSLRSSTRLMSMARMHAGPARCGPTTARDGSAPPVADDSCRTTRIGSRTMMEERAEGAVLRRGRASNEHVGLTALHTLFVREHNRLAAAIASENRELTGHEIFELARKIVGAQMQAITYNEFLPLLLGTGALQPYDGYDSEVDPSISNEFSTAAYRFGHTMLSPSLLLVDRSGDEREVSLLEAFFNPSMLMEEGISGLLRGLVRQQAQAVDPLVVDEIRNLLFGPPGSPGRAEHSARARPRSLGLQHHSQRVRFGAGSELRRRFVGSGCAGRARAGLRGRRGSRPLGGRREDHMPGSMIGETFRTIIAEQFQRLRWRPLLVRERPLLPGQPRSAAGCARDDSGRCGPPQHPNR